jgi:hypothetical protein
MQTRTLIGAAYWASALINGDRSGLSDEEKIALDRWMKIELKEDESVIDCGDPYFSWSYALFTHADANGGDLVEYTVISGDLND